MDDVFFSSVAVIASNAQVGIFHLPDASIHTTDFAVPMSDSAEALERERE